MYNSSNLTILTLLMLEFIQFRYVRNVVLQVGVGPIQVILQFICYENNQLFFLDIHTLYSAVKFYSNKIRSIWFIR